MSRSAAKVIGITLGDPAGIGPEVTAKALLKLKRPEGLSFLIIGDRLSKDRYFRRLPAWFEYLSIDGDNKKTYVLGKPNEISARLSYAFLQKSVELIKTKHICSVVTAPVSKEHINSVDPNFLGHTEYYAKHFSVKKYEMMFVSEQLKTVIVTRHIPVKEVPTVLTKQKIVDTIVLTQECLIRFFQLRRPVIAVCGLNPHAGEGGKIGREEISIIIPAIKRARKLGIDVRGPFAADTLFIPSKRNDFDVIISMFHDQGLIAIKTLYFDQVVNLTIGLPFIRTSPAHGTAFDIAGSGVAQASSMQQAIKLAIVLTA